MYGLVSTHSKGCSEFWIWICFWLPDLAGQNDRWNKPDGSSAVMWCDAMYSVAMFNRPDDAASNNVVGNIRV
jgi:hypothetical protein